jgi:hypothetical protein
MEHLSKSDEELLSAINLIMDNLMEGSSEINYFKHTRDFSSRIKNHISAGKFEEICNEYQSKWGFFENREFIALFRRQSSIAVIWRQLCSKTADEFVAEAVFKEEDGKIVVDHVFVF